MKQHIIIFALLLTAGCGYTTRGFHYTNDKIVVIPATNKINIASDNRKYSNFTSYPILLENRFTNVLINKFIIDGHLKVVSDDPAALKLSCEITDYQREAVKYTNSEDVKEQKLWLHVKMKLNDPMGEVAKERDIVGQASYFLTGANSKSEAAAQNDLIEDTARRVLEAIVEEW
ncbi:MAG: LPS assembly lipoprotein LptE [Candidatus Omnitrophota bacterium]